VGNVSFAADNVSYNVSFGVDNVSYNVSFGVDNEWISRVLRVARRKGTKNWRETSNRRKAV
jgi:hypothetical protein